MDPTLTRSTTWTAFLTALRAQGSDDQSVLFSGTLSRSSYGGLWSVESADGSRRPTGGSKECREALRDLHTLTGGTTVGVVARTEPGGTGNVALYPLPDNVSPGFGGALISSIVLVPDAVPAPYRRPSVPSSAEVSPAIDPDLVRTLVRSALPEATGLAAAEIDSWERTSGYQLPADVRALFQTANGGDLILPPGTGDDNNRHLLRIEPLDVPKPFFTASSRYGSDWLFGATEVVHHDPTGRVHPQAFSSAWVVLGDDWGGNLFIADLAPGPNGTVGQILFVHHEDPAEVQWVALSLTAWLTERPTRFERPPVTPGLQVRLLGDRTGLDAVTPDTEVLIVNQVDEPVDLSPLAGHPRLRSLEINPGPVTGLDVIGNLPHLEYLFLELPQWQHLLRNDLVPSTLLGVGLDGDAEVPEAVAVADQLLTRFGLPTIERIPVV